MQKTILGLGLMTLTAFASADDRHQRVYEVTITNLSKASQFTPILAATHRPSLAMFKVGEAPSAGLALMAEDGAVSLLETELTATGGVLDTANSADVLGSPPLLFAGKSVKLRLTTDGRRARLSMAAMILPTNDSFMALNSVELPDNGTVMYTAVGYDAGSEPNDEWCANIPGPTCGGAGASPDASGEGFVHVANGVHGIGDVAVETYDWRNPIARVEVRRVR